MVGSRTATRTTSDSARPDPEQRGRLSTKISRGSKELGDLGLWSQIIHHQLRVSDDEFFDAVDHGIQPVRDVPPEDDEEDAQPIEGRLVERLRHQVGLRDDEIREMTRVAAHQAWADWQVRPK